MNQGRNQWIAWASRLATPVLQAISDEQLRAKMPVEVAPTGNRAERGQFAHLEAVGRLLAGLSPWLEHDRTTPETACLAAQAQRALTVGTNPASPDYFNFQQGPQPLVDAAFLAQAIVRSPQLLWHEQEESTRTQLIEAMRLTRTILPSFNNWLLFSAMVEAFFAMVGEPWDTMRIDYALRQHEQWYVGDGAYKDGPRFHWDYYNGFVIHPMLLDILGEVSTHQAIWDDYLTKMLARTQRYAVVQERFIAPDGSFPAIGRSLTYRCGVFHPLAQLALRDQLPAALQPAQVRQALTTVIRRTLAAPETFDEHGWLRIGLCGHQPELAELYICTGSLYLCSTALLPLGLPDTHPFWSAPPAPLTAQQVWSGLPIPADHVIGE